MKLTLVSRMTVPSGGFAWRQYRRMTKPDGGAFEPANFLVEAPPRLGVSWMGPPRDLLEECPGLFLEFGDLECSEAAVAAFASQYGNLGIPTRAYTEGELASGESKFFEGELLGDWTRSIEDIAGLLGAWEALRTVNTARAAAWLASTGWRPGAAGEDRPDYVRFRAWRELLRKAEGHLRLFDRVNVEVGTHAEFAAPELLGVCSGVGPVVWLQFADAIARNRWFGRCGNHDQGCRSWVPGRPDNRKYCSPKCRMSAHYRMRKDRERREGETADGPAPSEG